MEINKFKNNNGEVVFEGTMTEEEAQFMMSVGINSMLQAGVEAMTGEDVSPDDGEMVH